MALALPPGFQHGLPRVRFPFEPLRREKQVAVDEGIARRGDAGGSPA
jgi:hypothetical protein